jgi:hypothetical protein
LNTGLVEYKAVVLTITPQLLAVERMGGEKGREEEG